MPIHDYECASCGHRFDALQAAGAAPLRKCPECGRLRLHKRASAPSFQLTGAGWRKPAAKPARAKRRTVGHTLDQGPRNGHGHSHGPGHKHHHHH